MKWIVVFFFLPIPGLAQERSVATDAATYADELVRAYATIALPANSAAPPEKIVKYLTKLSSKKTRYRSEQAFLEHVFNSTHQKFLKQYKELATFQDLVSNGAYNCLTATAWYAVVLERLGIPYEIIETNYHIFLLTQTGQGRVLLESTDPLGGFVTDPNTIERRIVEYKNGNITTSVKSGTFYQYKESFYRPVSLQQIKGLLWYNGSVAAYNKQDLVTAVQHLSNAYSFYHSSRLNEFSLLMEETVFKSELADENKIELIRALRSMRNVKSPAYAMNTSMGNQ